MQKNTTNIFENKNLDNFISKISEVMADACTSFWEKDIKAWVLAINDFESLRNEKLVYNIDFFTSQIKTEDDNSVAIRLSKEFVGNILETILKSREEKFDLTKLTELEIRILNAFCELIYKKMNEILIPLKDIKTNEKDKTKTKSVNFVFLMTDEGGNTSKIAVSIPSNRINFEPLKRLVVFNDADFAKLNVAVNLNMGYSTIKLSELKNLALDDIVLLENSDISKATLLCGSYEKRFSIKVPDSLVLKFDDEEPDVQEADEDTQNFEEVIMDKNLWDDIQIELNAEFEKVKMTLGDLKQISQGQIVDLGSIYDNEISLFAENKKVAKGELIIINDRYGVRLNEIFSSKPQAPAQKPAAQPAKPAQSSPAQASAQKPAAQPAKPQAQAAKPAQPAPRPAQPAPKQNPQGAKPPASPSGANAPDEEFDYSDFEK